MQRGWPRFWSVAAALAAAVPAAASGAELEAVPIRGEPAWSPYLVGAAIGVLSMLTFYFSDKPIGVSTAYARVAGMLGKLLAPRHTESLEYFKETWSSGR